MPIPLLHALYRADRGRRFGLWGVLLSGTTMAAPPAEMLLSPVIVTAEKRPTLVSETPAAITTLTAAMLEDSGAQDIKQAARYVPNLNVIEFTARAISNPKVRGVGGSPTNPAVTTVLDGVPLLNGDLSNLHLFDIQQLEYLRGPAGTLYGRNAPGGIVNILSRLPATDTQADAEARWGDDGERTYQGSVSQPLTEAVSASMAGGVSQRGGYNTNRVTGRELDFRHAQYGRLQMAYTPQDLGWQARLLYADERSRDGDFALFDLDALRQTPYQVSHDFTGYTRRKVQFGAVHAGYAAERWLLRSVTGYVPYTAREQTDLDLSVRDRLTRDNSRRGRQFTQEFNWASPSDAPLALWRDGVLDWQLGLFYFGQQTFQDAINFIKPAFLVEYSGVPLPAGFGIDDLPSDVRDQLGGARYRNLITLKDRGLGLYGQGTLRWQQWRMTLGLRQDYEQKYGNLRREFFYVDANGNVINDFDIRAIEAQRKFSNLSPRAVLAWQPRPQTLYYGSWSLGYRAGGFNVTPADGKETYREDRSRQLELGLKQQWLRQRLSVNMALFDLQLSNLQFNLPAPPTFYGNLGDFYIDNVGSAHNQGLELEIEARPLRTLSVFGTASLLKAHFKAGSRSQDVDISGNRVPLSASRSLSAGLQWRPRIGAWRGLLRPEYQTMGGYDYDESNQRRQPRYSDWNLRLGAERGPLRLVLVGRNLSDRAAVPLAIPFNGITPSGYAGENGMPRTLSLELSLNFP